MSDDRRYKSYLFNTIRQQTRTMSDYCQRKARQVQVATAWGLQVALYPVYALFQLARMGERILRQADTQGKRVVYALQHPEQDTLRSLRSDRAVRRVLGTVTISPVNHSPVPAQPKGSSAAQFEVTVARLPQRRLPVWQRSLQWLHQLARRVPSLGLSDRSRAFGLSQATELSPTHRLQVQGIASFCATRRLVLVTPEQRILDVLNPAQEHLLHQRICWELANFQRQVRLQRQGRYLRQPTASLALAPIRSQTLAPIRSVQQLMRWYQQGAIATQLNLFQEARLWPAATPSPQPAIPSHLGSLLSQWPLQLTPAALKIGDQQWAIVESQTQQKLQPIAHRLSQWLGIQMRRPLFTQWPPKQQQPALNNKPAPTPTLVRLFRPIQQWLDTALKTLVGPAPLAPFRQASPPPATQPTLQTPDTLSWNAIRGPAAVMASLKLQWPQVSQKLSQPPAAPTLSTAAAQRIGIPAFATASGSEIDIDAVFVAYEPHLLEQILQAIDQAIAWLEQQLFPILQRIWAAIRGSIEHLYH